jgi:PhoPQ-activated pathogenicity-related protein
MTALDRYVATPDASYRYSVEGILEEPLFTAYILRMQSQTWLTAKEVNRTAWIHDLKVVVPKKVRSSTGLLFIGGGANGRDVPDSVRKELAEIAVASGSVVTELGQVPNQPLVFKADPDQRERVEDALIAFGWTQFLNGGGEEWLARLPMTKSAVRAMDTITDVCQKEAQVKVDQFVVAGGSKRGWTTWTTAVVDPRVKAIVPIVIDMLNVRPSFRHHYQAYGFFAPAVDDYVEAGIMDWQDTERYGELIKVVEPFEYRERLTMPKLMLNAAGDQFFLPDSSQFYFDALKGEKYLRYVPNADHSLRGTDAYETLSAFYAMILSGTPRPQFSWTSEAEGSLSVTVKDRPLEARLWQASNADTRDFRMETIGEEAWSSELLKPDKDGRYRVEMKAPEKGWTAFMVELTYPTPAKVALKLTTAVDVVPRKLPFPPYEPKRP